LNMGLFDKNVGERDALRWIAAGYVALVIGLFTFITSPWGSVVFTVGLTAFFIGFYRCNPFLNIIARR
jgi:predicted membrane metal-binding protein